MRKTILILGMLIFISGFVLAAYSTDRTDYYFDGTYYITDGIEEADIALNGNIPSNGQNIGLYGWVTEHGCTYTNTKSSLGSLSVHCNVHGDNYRMMPVDEDFQGSWGMKVYIPCVGGSTWSGMKSGDANGNQMQLYYISALSQTQWSYGSTEGELLCDENSIPFVCDGWTELMMKYLDLNTVAAYVGGTLCHTFNSVSGIKFISMAEHSRDVNNAYFDEVWVANGDRPQTVLDSDNDGILSKIETNGSIEKPELRVTTGFSCPITCSDLMLKPISSLVSRVCSSASKVGQAGA